MDFEKRQQFHSKSQEEKRKHPKYAAMMQQRTRLPAFAHQEEVVQAIANHKITIISGETGSGKSIDELTVWESTILMPLYLRAVHSNAFSNAPQESQPNAHNFCLMHSRRPILLSRNRGEFLPFQLPNVLHKNSASAMWDHGLAIRFVSMRPCTGKHLNSYS